MKTAEVERKRLEIRMSRTSCSSLMARRRRGLGFLGYAAFKSAVAQESAAVEGAGMIAIAALRAERRHGRALASEGRVAERTMKTLRRTGRDRDPLELVSSGRSS